MDLDLGVIGNGFAAGGFLTKTDLYVGDYHFLSTRLKKSLSQLGGFWLMQLIFSSVLFTRSVPFAKFVNLKVIFFLVYC